MSIRVTRVQLKSPGTLVQYDRSYYSITSKDLSNHYRLMIIVNYMNKTTPGYIKDMNGVKVVVSCGEKFSQVDISL